MKKVQQIIWLLKQRPDLGAPSTAEDIHLSSVHQTLPESCDQPTIQEYNLNMWKHEYKHRAYEKKFIANELEIKDIKRHTDS